MCEGDLRIDLRVSFYRFRKVLETNSRVGGGLLIPDDEASA